MNSYAASEPTVHRTSGFQEVVSTNIYTFMKPKITLWSLKVPVHAVIGVVWGNERLSRVLSHALLLPDYFWHLLCTNKGYRMPSRRDSLTTCTVIPIFKKKYCTKPTSMMAHFSPHQWAWPFGVAINNFVFQLGWKTSASFLIVQNYPSTLAVQWMTLFSKD